MVWNRVLFIVCVFGFFKEFRPSEPFISPYLNGHWKNFTEAEINQNIYPVATYSNLVLLVVVFLLTDLLKYKPVILLEGIAGIITWSLMPLGTSLVVIQVAQFFYGLFYATEVAYYSYMYAKMDKKNYQRATAVTKSTLLISKASSSFISQVLVLLNLMDYHELNYLTLGAMLVATICATFLPPVSKSAYFHRNEPSSKVPLDSELEETNELGELKASQGGKENKDMDCTDDRSRNDKKDSILNSFLYLVKDFEASVKNKHILKWSIWWALSLCGYLQVTYYMQLLWQTIINKDDGSQGIYHGFSNCANSLIGAICTYLIGFLKLKWDLYGEVVLALCSVIQGSILLYGAHINHLITCYFLYMTFRVLYQASSTIASAEIAKHIKAESYALVFGVSTFIALVGQSCLTGIVIDTLKLNIRTQFVIYGNYYISIGASFLIAGTFTLIRHSRNKKLLIQNKNPPTV